ncbi:unnamed protein product [Chironomus riparius]|uniref:Integrin alpha second immunoglobulin-like domain-containing protein n=1 Tax=Chironomus riparius TaxID=315576 RepID=A0A9N9WZQ0_9DIPT|nr:unnamed protein product [Chironomus riparius]
MRDQIFLLIFLINFITAFNLSPVPNIIISKREVFLKYKDYIRQERSSFFGFSINLRKSHIIISAPRAQPIVEKQKHTEEPGAILKCEISRNVTIESCYEYIFDKSEEFVNVSKYKNKKVIDSETKDFQLLGFSMDGGGSESNKFVICAPHLKALSQTLKINETANYYLHGLCSWVNDTVSREPENYTKIGALRFFDEQNRVDDKISYYNYKYGESGFSVHMTENDDEIIIGCPGIYNWKGSIIRQSLHKEQVFNTIDYEADVVNASLFKLSIVGYSYFGYSVSSAKILGTNKTYYIASAPRVNHRGLVYIFEITNNTKPEKKFLIRKKIHGSQYGEYFGYAVMCEDFNNDGLPDIVVSAPFYTNDELHDNGAVYVFINIGNMKFKSPTILQSSFKGSGRFGMSISKLGDVNLDGYNDLLISAPFEEDGAAYLYFGRSLGISPTPIQKIQAPKVDPNEYAESFTKPMFGFGLSHGIDIDGNGFNDVAIGAPNSEVVFIYRSYPIIRINSILNLSKHFLNIDSKTINASFCAKYSSKSKVDMAIKIKMILTLDPIFKRVTEIGTNRTIIIETLILSKNDKCINYKLNIKTVLTKIFWPIEIKVDYDLVDKINKDDSNFCKTCVMLDLKDPKSLRREIAFSTGCNSTDCKVDLSIIGTLQNVSQPFILGSEKTITITYKIDNFGEPAYSTKLTIEMSSNLTQFSRLPTSCNIANNIMYCDINNKKPIFNQTSLNMKVIIDVTQLDGKLFEIKAKVSSIGNETKMLDNISIVKIVLTELSEIAVSSTSSSPEIHLSDTLIQNIVNYNYQIFNYGPSNIKKLSITLQIPIMYDLAIYNHVKIIEFDGDANLTVSYKNKQLEVNWTKLEFISNFSNKNKEGIDFDSSTLGFNYELNHQELEPDLSHFRKRSVDSKGSSNLNYDNKLNLNDSTEHNSENLQSDRTIVLDCMQSDDKKGCIKVEFVVEDFQTENEPIIINFNYSFILHEFERIFVNSKSVFIYKTNIKFNRIGDDNTTQTFNVTFKNPQTIIYKNVIVKVPLEVFIMSGVIGILVFILLLWGLKNCGFFKRNKKVELQKLKRESLALDAQQMQYWARECEKMKFK